MDDAFFKYVDMIPDHCFQTLFITGSCGIDNFIMLIDNGGIVYLQGSSGIDFIAVGEIGQSVGFATYFFQALDEVGVVRAAGKGVVKYAVGLYQMVDIHVGDGFGNMGVGFSHFIKQQGCALAHGQGCHPQFEDIQSGKGRFGILQRQGPHHKPFAGLRLQEQIGCQALQGFPYRRAADAQLLHQDRLFKVLSRSVFQ